MAAPNRFHAVIIGGGVGGVSSATHLRQMNEHCEITLIEKGPWVSSTIYGAPHALDINAEGKVEPDNRTHDILKTEFNINIKTNSEVLCIKRDTKTVSIRNPNDSGIPKDCDAQDIAYDKLIIATGASFIPPDLPGGNLVHVFTLASIEDLRKIQRFISTHSIHHAAILGGGFISLEVLDSLANLQLELSLLVVPPYLLSTAIDWDIAEILHEELRRNSIKLMLNAKAVEITGPNESDPGYVHFQDGGRIRADIVIMDLGTHGRNVLAERAGLLVTGSSVNVHETFQTSDRDIYAVGGVISTPDLASKRLETLFSSSATRQQGRLAAEHICGRSVHYHGHLGTSICRIFGMTVAEVGLCNSELSSLAGVFDYVTVHTQDEAQNHPGATSMTLRVIFDTKNGLLLGAQAVGTAGANQQINVIATALRAGITVAELGGLELAYSSLDSPAMELINLAGLFGANVMKGDVKLVHCYDIESLRKICEGDGDKEGHNLDDYQFIDVRSPEHFAKGHLKNSINIPITQLRVRCRELSREQPTILYSHTGYRGHLAYRILDQNNFRRVFNLDGGYRSIIDGGYNDLVVSNK